MAVPVWARGLRFQSDVSLAQFTTYKRGGSARWFLEVESEASLRDLAVPADVAVCVLGRGSNLLVSDSGFDGLILHVGQGLADISFSDGSVVAEGGVSLPTLARAAAAQEAGGLGFFVGIPGSVGGAVAMNAGCFGSETADVLISATVHNLRTGEPDVRLASEFDFGYRRSLLASDELVLSARFATSSTLGDLLREEMREITRWRKEHQPGGTRNAGSVFKNPDDAAAGKVIDELALKGLSIGGASVSEKHGNFIVTGPDATSQDVFDLIYLVQATVLERTGIELKPEIRMIGFPSAGEQDG